jgi:cell division protein FtsI/penicillin-binding protein 2
LPAVDADRRRALLIVAGAVVALGAGAGAFLLVRGDDGPRAADAIAAFVDAWREGDRSAMEELVTEPSSLEDVDPLAVAEQVGATEVELRLGETTEERREATAPLSVGLHLGDRGTIDWTTRLSVVDVEDDGWRVEWTPDSLHPSLPEGGTIDRVTTWEERAPILGAGGETLVGPVEVIRIGIEPRRFDRVASAGILADALGLDPADIDAALDAPGVQPDHFVQIHQLRPEAFELVRDVVFPIPGVTFPRADVRGGPVDGFARHLVGRFGEVTAERLEQLGPPYEVGDRVGLDGLEAQYEEELAGTPAIAVRIVDADGETVTELAHLPGTEPEPLVTTIDLEAQLAAEAALDGVTVPAAIVAVDAASGEVRAAASRPLGDAFNRAIGGAYPPGSTFKVVTGYALLSEGLTPSSQVQCPAELEVDGRRFRNFEGGASGAEPFSAAFAESCNTAFIGEAQKLSDGALADAAGTFGFGVDYTLGPTTLGGSFPDPESAVARAASAIGQAEVTASPLHMASVAAAVLDGRWRTPRLLAEAAEDAAVTELDPAIQATLRELMGLVVREGSGTAAQVPGIEVIGKTGTAEFGTGDPPPTHAWFVGAAEDLGFAILLEGGGVGGRAAAPLAARFVAGLP